MKIVVMDGHAANPGDLSWEAFEDLGDLAVYERTRPEQVIERARDAEAVTTNKVVFDAAVLEQLPALRYIGVLATGYNVVDIPAAKDHGVTVTNVPAYSTDSVAQHIFALLLEIVSRVAAHDASVHRGEWVRSPDFAYTLTPPRELAGKTLGIVGLGRTGSAVARIALAMGMRVLAVTRRPFEFDGVERVDFEQMLAEADIVSPHCPLTDETRGLIDADALAKMKDGAILLNASRGAVIDEQAVRDALERGKLAAAGVDVLTPEPPGPDNPLLEAPNCIITPHMAWASYEARKRLLDVAAENLRAFIDDQAQNVVS